MQNQIQGIKTLSLQNTNDQTPRICRYCIEAVFIGPVIASLFFLVQQLKGNNLNDSLHFAFLWTGITLGIFCLSRFLLQKKQIYQAATK